MSIAFSKGVPLLVLFLLSASSVGAKPKEIVTIIDRHGRSIGVEAEPGTVTRRGMTETEKKDFKKRMDEWMDDHPDVKQRHKEMDDRSNDFWKKVKTESARKQRIEDAARDRQERDEEAAEYRAREAVQQRQRAAARAASHAQFCAKEEAQLRQVNQLRKTGKSANAITLLRQLTAEGSPNAPLILGTMYQKGDGVKADKQQALKCFYSAARNGSNEGAYCVARSYFQGDGVKQDAAQSVTWLKASNAPNAQYLLGSMYMDGNNVEKNYSRAWDACKKAASLNYAPAQSTLGELCYLGLGMRKNTREAKKWFDDAARARDPKALFYLSKMYATGDGVPCDQAKANSLVQAYKAAAAAVKPKDALEQKFGYADLNNFEARFQRLSKESDLGSTAAGTPVGGLAKDSSDLPASGAVTETAAR